MMNRFEIYSYSKKEVATLVDELNTTYDEVFNWKYRRAKKTHIDLFGKKIHQGNHYWRVTMGGSYSNDLILSEESMERFVYAIFAPYPKWEGTYHKEEIKTIPDIRAVIKKLDESRNRLRT